jgi:hypothetical protein
MKIRYCIIGFFTLIFVLGVLSIPVIANSQPILFFTPDVVESNTGDDEQVLLMMDGAPRGLSGYGIIITVDNPDIAGITGLDLPVWVGLKDIKKLTEASYLIQGADSNDKQDPGAVQISLANIKIHAKAPGYATILATPVIIDDDLKGRFELSPVTGTIVITGAGPVPVIPMNS